MNVDAIQMPPLRHRQDDIELLATGFLRRAAKRHSKAAATFSPDVLEVFFRYRWPGNVRQLENLVERMVILSQGDKIGLHSLPAEMLDGPHVAPDQPGDVGWPARCAGLGGGGGDSRQSPSSDPGQRD
jgi:two-component system response regulator HydG